MKSIEVAAADFGASSYKMAVAEYDGTKVQLLNYINNDNIPIEVPGAMYWDLFGFYSFIRKGIADYISKGSKISSLSIDSWGATYGLLDTRGRIMEPVYHYRDRRTEHVEKEIQKVIDKREVFRLTGCQYNRTYTFPQLFSYKNDAGYVLENAKYLLFLPDLLEYFLCGEITSERTIAGTSSLLKVNQTDWCYELCEKTKIPTHFLTALIEPGTFKGNIRKQFSKETAVTSIRVIASAGHDSASAVLAIPDFGVNKLYISVGTNINMGMEGRKSLVSEAAYQAGIKNTGGFGGTILAYRDFPACWILNELKKELEQENIHKSFKELMLLAGECRSQNLIFDVESEEFCKPEGRMRMKINNYLRQSGQQELHSVGEFVLCILESIAEKAAFYAGKFAEISGADFEGIYVIGGGTQNSLLMQLICNALGREIHVGLPHASLAGNAMAQLYAGKYVCTIEEIRDLSARSFTMELVEPKVKMEKKI